MTTRGKSLFECVNGLRYFGKGTHVTRSIYKFPETYYILHRVMLSKDQVTGKIFLPYFIFLSWQKHGVAYGRMVWRGRPKAEVKKIGAVLKREWSVVRVPDYSVFKGKIDDVADLADATPSK